MKTIIVDSNNICYIAKFSMKGLSYGEMETGVIFGFLNQIKNFAQKFDTRKFLFCWDSKKSKRKEIYPEYKAHRHEDRTEEERLEDNIAFKQFSDLRTNILPELGFRNNFIQTGYESDDLMAAIVKEPPSDNRFDFIIVSTDDDLLQLLNYCDIYNPRTKKTITSSDFIEEYEIGPDQWSAVKAMAGCSSDNVEGIEGVGIAKAMSYIREDLPKGKILNRIRDDRSSEIVKRNSYLVHLPFAGTICPEIKKDCFTFDNFINVFERYNFQSFLRKENLAQWKKLFRLEENL